MHRLPLPSLFRRSCVPAPLASLASHSASRLRHLSTALSSPPQSSVARGTQYEHQTSSLLSSLFGMSLTRCGGAGDGGVDLRGWWPLPFAPTQRVRVVVQCKCQDPDGKKLGPVIVREVQGVVHSYEREEPLVAVIASSTGFSKQALLKALSSRAKLVLLHLEYEPEEKHDEEGGRRCKAIVWNEALAGKEGVLEGRLEVRWSRKVEEGGWEGPVVVCDGRQIAP